MTRRGKDVLLLVLAVVALVVALYTFRHKPAPAPAPQAQATAASAAGKEKAKGGEATESPGATQTASATGAPRNPFAGPGPEGVVAASTPEVKPVGPAPAGPKVSEGKGEPVPSIPPTPAPAAASMPPLPGAGQTAGPRPEQGLTLTGIVRGRRTMAVIREGEKRYYAVVGDRIGDYRVQTIGQREVVLADREGKVILRMGGRQ